MSGEHTQDPLPGESGEATVRQDRRKGGASQRPISHFTPQPAEEEPVDPKTDPTFPPKITPTPPTTM